MLLHGLVRKEALTLQLNLCELTSALDLVMLQMSRSWDLSKVGAG